MLRLRKEEEDRLKDPKNVAKITWLAELDRIGSGRADYKPQPPFTLNISNSRHSSHVRAVFSSVNRNESSDHKKFEERKLRRETGDIQQLKAVMSPQPRGSSSKATVTEVLSMNPVTSKVSPSPPSYNDVCPSFVLFSELPTELRMKIWEATLNSRIVRWTRTNDRNVFTAPSRSLTLMLVSKEAREAAFLYGGYQNLTDYWNPVYFSPKMDYLWFDPGWTGFGFVSSQFLNDPLESLLPNLGEISNIMVHPNWSGHHRRPTVLFGKVPSIRKVLVAADEKSIEFHGKVMLETVKEIKNYYAALTNQGQVTKTPYVAVGCVGWVGEERRRMHHGSEDNRQLVKIFEKQWEMNLHMLHLREEKWQFTHHHFNRPKIVHKLRFVRETEESARKLSSPGSSVTG